MLYLNSALAHFAEERPGCSFCTIEAKRELRIQGILEEMPEYDYYLRLVQPENTSHIFWECEHVQAVIQEFFAHIRTENGMGFGRANIRLDKSVFFRGEIRSNLGKAKAELIIYHFVKYYIYQCRFRQRLPNYLELRRDFNFLTIQTGNARKWGRYMLRTWEIFE